MACALLAVSPHLDDAVLGCGALLAAHPGTQVVTVFAGCHGAETRSTGWDRASGFSSAAQALAMRQEEDRAALRCLGARPTWLPFCDAQYGKPVSVDEISAALEEQIRHYRPRLVLMPLGLFHSDHILVAEACTALMKGGRSWLAYEDALYRRIPGAVQERLKQLGGSGITATPDFALGGRQPLKLDAARCYRSQLQALADAGHALQAELGAPERYWSLRAGGPRG